MNLKGFINETKESIESIRGDIEFYYGCFNKKRDEINNPEPWSIHWDTHYHPDTRKNIFLKPPFVKPLLSTALVFRALYWIFLILFQVLLIPVVWFCDLLYILFSPIILPLNLIYTHYSVNRHIGEIIKSKQIPQSGSGLKKGRDSQKALVKKGKSSTNKLIKALNTENVYCLCDFIDVLGEIGDIRATEPLTQLMIKKLGRCGGVDFNPDIQAIIALGKIGDERSIPALIKAIDDFFPQFGAYTEYEDGTINYPSFHAINALSKIDNVAMIPELLKSLENGTRYPDKIVKLLSRYEDYRVIVALKRELENRNRIKNYNFLIDLSSYYKYLQKRFRLYEATPQDQALRADKDFSPFVEKLNSLRSNSDNIPAGLLETIVQRLKRDAIYPEALIKYLKEASNMSSLKDPLDVFVRYSEASYYDLIEKICEKNKKK